MSTVSSSLSTSVRGLNAVYTALDNHQYTRCIKLCQQILAAQPTTSLTIVSALLAHAYAKSGQRYKAVSTIQGIFQISGNVVFAELQLFLKYARFEKELVESSSSAPSAAAPQQPPPPSNKKGGKKKAMSSGNNSNSSISVEKEDATPSPSWDWIDQLATPPRLPDDWEQLLPSADCLVYQDSNFMGTLSLTLSNVLRLPLTAYQMYSWALAALEASSDPSLQQYQVVYAVKAYLHGIAVLVVPQYAPIHTTLLKQLQVLALQITRLQQQQPQSPQSLRRCSMLWAAQNALWQCTLLLPEDSSRRALLPRLAESLASKCLDLYCPPHTLALVEAASENGDEDEKHASHLVAIESFLLYIKTLKLQEKWNVMLEAVEDRLLQHSQQEGRTDISPRQTLLELKYEALSKISSVDDLLSPNSALRETVEELLHMYPDDWIYWKQHLESSIAESQGDVSAGCSLTDSFRLSILGKSSGSSTATTDGNNAIGQKYLLRGPHLMRVEIAACLLTVNDAMPADSEIVALIDCIMSYGNAFASRASCIFSDLLPYLERCLSVCTVDHAHVLLQWSKDLRNDVPSGPDAKERLKQLRVYIFAVQINFKVLYTFADLQSEELPSWEVLVDVWRSFQAFENSENVDQAQKESRPADELILLAVQLLLQKQPRSTLDLVIAANLLESGIQYSPYNANLKILAMFVFSDLNAASRSWDLFNELHVKHIQYESLSYLIFPILRSGGMFRETILVGREILGLHQTASREVADYTGRAMESGSVSKAEEFLLFHRDKMCQSLTALEGKGLILDMAPLLVDENDGVLGAEHGIVGADTDFERVKQMITEAHNPNGVFSLLQVEGSLVDLITKFSDNRDFNVLSYEILWRRHFDSPEIILRESLRRGHQHNLLIRSVLCVEATKGPKKGKVTKSSLELQKRCSSLLKFADRTDSLCSSIVLSDHFVPYLHVMCHLCLAVVALSSGLAFTGEFLLETLDSREEVVVENVIAAKESLNVARSNTLENHILSVSDIGHLIPDSLVPCFALFQMVAKVADIFGWGRRKRKTKRCAGALSEFALLMTTLIDDLLSQLERSTLTCTLHNPDVVDNLPVVLDLKSFHETSTMIQEMQALTHLRLSMVLKYIKGCLVSFDVDE